MAVTHHAGSWTNGTFYIHNNHRGDIILVRSGTTTVSSYDYSAFGNLQSAIGPDFCRFKFSSKERNPSTGYSYYGYRFYAPAWQRWISRDPIGEQNGANLFCFVRNSPVCVIDPVGLKFDRWRFAACMADAGLNFLQDKLLFGIGTLLPDFTYVQCVAYGDCEVSCSFVDGLIQMGDWSTQGKGKKMQRANKRWKLAGKLAAILGGIGDIKDCVDKARNPCPPSGPRNTCATLETFVPW
ncbi:MAG: RHS repeat-associated core domain-containing protein [Verrucomicrobiae bacterium]|nr:RHS repeat-associated core domain-containing protein [Verrucomicrobiae bacterium]